MITRLTKSTVTITMMEFTYNSVLKGFNGMIVKLLYTYYSRCYFSVDVL